MLFVNCSDHLVYTRVVLKPKATALKAYKMPALIKRDEEFTVYEYDNGYMLQCSGRDDKDEWATSKVIYSDQPKLIEGIIDLLKLPKS